MSLRLTFVITAMYAYIAYCEMVEAREPWALMFFGYALANIGVMWGLVRSGARIW